MFYIPLLGGKLQLMLPITTLASTLRRYLVPKSFVTSQMSPNEPNYRVKGRVILAPRVPSFGKKVDDVRK